MSKTVAFLGLGTMGGAMTANLLKGRFAVRGYDPSPEASAAADKAGVRTFSSAAEAAAEADLICSVVPQAEHVSAAYLGPKGALEGAAEGTVCFDFSTIAPRESIRIAEEVNRRGFRFLDTPVSGSAPSARAATLSVMAGGDSAALEEHRDVLVAMTQSVRHFGPNGSGLKMKMVSNLLVSTQLCVFAEGLTLGRKAGLDPEKMMEHILGSPVCEVIRSKGAHMARKDYEPTFRVDLMLKDLRLIGGLAESVRAPVHFASLARQVYTGTSALGLGAKDQNAILEYFERGAALEE